jgi:alpha-L-arabinofuranosidase
VTTRGIDAKQFAARVLTTPAMNAHNTFDKPNTVQPAPFKAGKRQGQDWVFELPPKSVVVVTFK